eukprot:Gb_28345 [translate_table: standard]
MSNGVLWGGFPPGEISSAGPFMQATTTGSSPLSLLKDWSRGRQKTLVFNSNKAVLVNQIRYRMGLPFSVDSDIFSHLENGTPSLTRRYAKMLESYHTGMNDMFEAYGSFIAHHPLIPITFGIILLGGLSIGLINIQDETDLEKLWVEHNSRVVEENRFFNDKFGGVPRKEGLSINSKSKEPLDMIHAMDALTLAIKPLYDSLSMSVAGSQGWLEFDQYTGANSGLASCLFPFTSNLISITWSAD